MEKALIGYGGHAREVMAQMGSKITCFVDDEFVTEDCLPLSFFDPEKFEVMIAIASSSDRARVAERLPKKTKYFTFIHPTALIMESVKVGKGGFVGAYSILTTNIEIGDHFILNRGNHIGHDCKIGDFFSMMPSSVIGGNVIVGDRVYMGSCSNVREKIQICSDVIVGMNSAVVKDISFRGTYVGVPSKIINER